MNVNTWCDDDGNTTIDEACNMKAGENTAWYYQMLRCAADRLRGGNGRVEVLADRPLNHGHLIVCRVWFGFLPRRAWEAEYRFCIDGKGDIYVVDVTPIRGGKRCATHKAYNDKPVCRAQPFDDEYHQSRRAYRLDSARW